MADHIPDCSDGNDEPGTTSDEGASIPAQGMEAPTNPHRRTVARVSTEEHWEVVRAELLPMYVERRTSPEIAEAFSVSVNTASTWRKRLIDDLREEASQMQPRDYILESMMSLRMARAEAWKCVHESEEVKDRRAGLQLVAQVESQSTKLGTQVGFFDGPSERLLQGSEEGADVESARLLKRMLAEMLVPVSNEGEC